MKTIYIKVKSKSRKIRNKLKGLDKSPFKLKDALDSGHKVEKPKLFNNQNSDFKSLAFTLARSYKYVSLHIYVHS